MPATEFTADLDPLPVPDDPLEIPALCEQWMPAPAADPVFSYLQASSAPAITLPAAWNAPVFALTLARHVCAVDRANPVGAKRRTGHGRD